MERINLNVRPETRRRLRAVAAAKGATEAEVARELLTRALDELERAEFYQAIADHYSDDVRRRELEILSSFEAIGG